VRRAKLKKIYGSDCHRWRLTAHAQASGPSAEVDISVTEKDDGTLIIEVERSEGMVVLIAGKVQLNLKAGEHFKVHG
jgi:hypothetical protein